MNLTSVSSLSFSNAELLCKPLSQLYHRFHPYHLRTGQEAQHDAQHSCHGHIDNALGQDLRARILSELRPFQASHRPFPRPFLQTGQHVAQHGSAPAVLAVSKQWLFWQMQSVLRRKAAPRTTAGFTRSPVRQQGGSDGDAGNKRLMAMML